MSGLISFLPDRTTPPRAAKNPQQQQVHILRLLRLLGQHVEGVTDTMSDALAQVRGGIAVIDVVDERKKEKLKPWGAGGCSLKCPTPLNFPRAL